MERNPQGSIQFIPLRRNELQFLPKGQAYGVCHGFLGFFFEQTNPDAITLRRD